MDIKLRTWNKDDLPTLVAMANDEDISRNLMNTFPHPYTNDDGQRFIDMAISSKIPHLLAITIDNKLCGGIGLHQLPDIFIKNMELGYWVGKPYWNRGIATHAVKQMVRYGFETFPIERIFARPFGSNIASQKVLMKAHFELEAKLKRTIYKNDRWEDEWIFAIRRS